MQWWGVLGPLETCLCNMRMCAKHWEHCSRETQFLALKYYSIGNGTEADRETNQGNKAII